MSLDQQSGTLLFPDKLLTRLKAPGQETNFKEELNQLVCQNSGNVYPYDDGVPTLFFPEGRSDEHVTSKVRAFYEENPFPNYDGLEEFGDLVQKGSQNDFSSKLLEAIGNNKLILECGCGTGQLTNFLQLNNNQVLGIDMSLNSLKLALNHKKLNALPRSAFAQMNIFNLAIKDNTFDVVISHGVLHHTYDAQKAFSKIVKKLKPGGIILIGLYNRFARIPTFIRSKLIGVLGQKIDYVVRNQINDARKSEIWIKDQYYNPHETWHSIDEVLNWFDENDIDFLNTAPGILDTEGEKSPKLFSRSSRGTHYQRVVTQLMWLTNIAREGALFDVIGRKRD